MSHDETKVSASNSHKAIEQAGAADPEVVPKASRRQFTAEYKRRVLAEADPCHRSPAHCMPEG